MVQLKTDRLLIRPIVENDWRAIRDVWRDFSASEYAQYDMPHDTEDEAVRQRMIKWVQHSGWEHMFFAICLNKEVIGYIAFNIREIGYEIGYCFHSAYQGKGYARESLSALLHHLHTLGITSFSAGTALRNKPSVALLAALGFKLDATENVSFYTDNQGRPIIFEGGIFKKTMV